MKYDTVKQPQPHKMIMSQSGFTAKPGLVPFPAFIIATLDLLH